MTDAAARKPDPRYAELQDFKRRLFPELVCPEHNEVGQRAAASRPTRYVWCTPSGAKAHWFLSRRSQRDPLRGQR